MKAKLGLLSGFAAVGLTIFGFTAYTTLEAVKIGGYRYSNLKLHQSALSDFTPSAARLIDVDW
ncbi:MAG: hypothetical protein N2651_01715 [Fimbriimonadales bacterium]|nr:hypothetical protein [Fimbriimonadales bacterium]